MTVQSIVGGRSYHRRDDASRLWLRCPSGQPLCFLETDQAYINPRGQASDRDLDNIFQNNRHGQCINVDMTSRDETAHMMLAAMTALLSLPRVISQRLSRSLITDTRKRFSCSSAMLPLMLPMAQHSVFRLDQLHSLPVSCRSVEHCQGASSLLIAGMWLHMLVSHKAYMVSRLSSPFQHYSTQKFGYEFL